MIDILVPAEQEGTKAIVRSWLRSVGDHVSENDPLVELETDKVTQEVPSPASGILAEILLGTDAEAVPGAVLGRLTVDQVAGVGVGAESDAQPLPNFNVPRTDASDALRLSPSVRRAVRQHGIDPSTISGSGRGGRITRADVDRVIAGRVEAPLSAESEAAGAFEIRSVPHDRMRKAIASNMLSSVSTAPHVTAFFEADFSRIVEHRARHKAVFERQGVPLSYTAYIIAACVTAMRDVPEINSRWYDERLDIFEDINVGVGTALGSKGLVVPVIHRAQDLSLMGIAGRLATLLESARSDRLRPEDVRGGTFTISNHGVSGSLFAAPIIIPQPQSAILGVGKLEKRVVVREMDGVDTIQIRPMAYVSLTIDHRVVDGHQTNRWLCRFVEVLENWTLDDKEVS